MQNIASSLLPIAVFVPLFTSIFSGVFGRRLGDKSATIITITGMIISALSSIYLFSQFFYGHHQPDLIPTFNWIEVDQFQVSWNLKLDMLTVSMMAMVTTISLLIHIYSVSYMSHEEMPTYRFFSYLSLFTFSMLLLVASCNLVQLFCGWEAVGLSSYLLIGYWYTKPAAVAAAIKAFVVNRIADLFFLIGICLLFTLNHSIEFTSIFNNVSQLSGIYYHLLGFDFKAYELISLLLFIGAMGKSAQLFFHVWLPDAMEGPTPVSALIHAATMVTAGVFLMARMSPLVDIASHAKEFILIIGACTAFFAGTVAIVQPDIKKSIAYSTCSQLGYMFVAIGCSAYSGAMFHLTTHAFFKALLFLGAGSVIHALHDEQDMFKMGGLARKLPLTCIMMWLGSLALAGIFPFAGYWSKDFIMEAAWNNNTNLGYFAWGMTAITALLTGIYSWRLLFLVFHVQSKNPTVTDHAHESNGFMIFPMGILAIGSVVAGFLLAPYYIGIHQTLFWGQSLINDHMISNHAHSIPFLIEKAPLLMGGMGIIIAVIGYILVPSIPTHLAASLKWVYQFLLNAWYFDKLYQMILIKPYQHISKWLWKVGDEEVVQGGPIALANLISKLARGISWTQNGSFALYAFTMVIGLIIILATFIFSH